MSSIPLFWWLVLLFLIAGMGGLYAATQRVPQGFEYLVERRGRYLRTIGAGSHLIVPGVDRIGAQQDIREAQLPLKSLSLVTRDEVSVEVALTCFVQIVDSAKASYEVKAVRAALEELIVTATSGVLAGCPLTQLVSDRERLLRELPERLDRATDAWGVKVTRLDIRDVRLPSALLDAILEERRAECAQRAALLQAETERMAALEAVDRARLLEVAASDAALAAATRSAQHAEQQQQLDHAALLAQQTRALEARGAQLATEQADALALSQHAQDRFIAERAQRQLEAQRARELHDEEVASEQERAALAWRQVLEHAEREREAAQVRHVAEQAEEAHQTSLALAATERARETQRLRDLADAERATQLQQIALTDAAIAREQAEREPSLREEQAQREHAKALADVARARELERSRLEAARDKQELELLTAQRVAQLAYQEATLRAQAREVVADADARAVQKLATALGGATSQAVTYLAAREHADALRSLGQSNARMLVVPGSDGSANLDVLARLATEPTERG